MVSEPESVQDKTVICPSCGQTAQFIKIGVQKWPQYIVLARGLPSEMSLWTCQSCYTTLCETTLGAEVKKQSVG